MSVPFPEELSGKQLLPLRVGPKRNVVRTPTDAGPGKQGRRFTAAALPVQLSYGPLSNFEMLEFWDWYEGPAKDGSELFTWRHWKDDSVVTYRFADDPVAEKSAGGNGKQGTWMLVFSLTLEP